MSDTPNLGHIMAPTPSYECGLGYVPGQTPAPVSRASTTASSHSGSVTPTPALQQSSAPWSRSSVTPTENSSDETGSVDDGESMEE